MLWVGLTGGIGAGKSAVSRALTELGASLVDADVLAREVVAPGTEGLAAVVEAFGQEVLQDDGSLDREALGRVVFGDDEARRRLNGIVHPLVGARTAQLAAEAEEAGARVLVHDVPLLVEGGLGPAYHLVVVVASSLDERLRRLTRLRGMTEGDARARIAAQATDEQRAAAADVVLSNDGTLERLSEAVCALWEDRLLPYADNVEAGRPAEHSPAAVVPPDAAWPAQGRRLAERVGLLTGARVEHVGPTAVPGLPAPDRLELQVEADDVHAARRALGPGGFPATDDGDGQLHRSADPGRAVDVRVHQAGSPAAARAVALRDRLREDAAARDRLCRAVAGVDDEDAYRAAVADAVAGLEDSEQ